VEEKMTMQSEKIVGREAGKPERLEKLFYAFFKV